MKNITVVGSGYVGMANGVALSQQNNVIILDINSERVNKIRNNESPIEDKLITEFLNSEDLTLTASTNKETAYNHACLLYTSPSPRDKRQSRMPSSA